MDKLREHLLDQLVNEHAHTSFSNAVSGLTPNEVGIQPDSLPYSIWQLVEHIRIAQSDIVQFCIDPDYQSPEWPKGYWPTNAAPSGTKEWKDSIKQIESDLQQMVELVKDPKNDLFEPFPHGDGQTLFREAILVIDHNSYHTGQIVTMRRLLGLW
ncbi:DinB family protein [Aliifodinibius sp. S!AR15-10]|uniref:DinB family protein n=1 Tax=Aliifodinibius sp. S!AR15-10 TaxID=2950437 RepID=UPI0028642731|nr:DinB family protein [Aliifodinibius sp. S!AR15-10]MDR8391346.1 DinB family protein [Aliifodinibius sp. S!AR15-10]